MLLSMLSGRRGMLAAHRLGRSLPRRDLNRLGFRIDRASSCHATLTETLRILDPDAMERAFSQISIVKSDGQEDAESPRQIFLSTAKRCAVARIPTGEPNMCFPHFVRLLSSRWGMSRPGEGAWKSLMHCAFWTKLIWPARS